jgi:hypothetical protein
MSPERDNRGSEALVVVVEECDVALSEFGPVIEWVKEQTRAFHIILYPLFMVHPSPDVALRHLVQSLPQRPYQKDGLDKLVSEVLQDKPSKSSQDVLRGQWELALKNEIFDLAVRVILSFHNAWCFTYYLDERRERTQRSRYHLLL